MRYETQEPEVYRFLEKSIMYAVGTRCGFDLFSEEQDFSRIVDYSDEEVNGLMYPQLGQEEPKEATPASLGKYGLLAMNYPKPKFYLFSCAKQSHVS